MRNKVFVSNLPYTTSDVELEKIFSGSGKVTDVKVVIDRETGRSRGFGFVSFENDDQASKAIQDWNDQEFCGRRLIVNEAQERRPGVGNSRPIVQSSNNRPQSSNGYNQPQSSNGYNRPQSSNTSVQVVEYRNPPMGDGGGGGGGGGGRGGRGERRSRGNRDRDYDE